MHFVEIVVYIFMGIIALLICLFALGSVYLNIFERDGEKQRKKRLAEQMQPGLFGGER